MTIEDTYELALHADPALHPDVVAMQSRDANVEGEGAIDMTELFRSGLRMSPDRVLVGEIRGHEVIPMLNAMSQGNDGSLGTIHASSSAGVFKKLALYAAQAPERLEPATTNILVAESVHLVVHLSQLSAGRRLVTSVREVVDADGLSVASNEIMRSDPTTGRAVPGSPPSSRLLTTLTRAGFDPGVLEHARTHPGRGLGAVTLTTPLAALLGLGTGFGVLLVAMGLFRGRQPTRGRRRRFAAVEGHRWPFTDRPAPRSGVRGRGCDRRCGDPLARRRRTVVGWGVGAAGDHGPGP